MKSGASESTIEAAIEIDRKSNILRAVAMGATEFKMGDSVKKDLTADELHDIAAQSMRLPAENVTEAASAGKWHIFDGLITRKLLGLFLSRKHIVRVLDRSGVVCFQREGLGAVITTKAGLNKVINTSP